MPTQNTAPVILAEEEISDVSLATFYVFDKENAPIHGVRLALVSINIGHGNRGCGHGGCGHGGCGHSSRGCGHSGWGHGGCGHSGRSGINIHLGR
jgi:hypothetical protein